MRPMHTTVQLWPPHRVQVGVRLREVKGPWQVYVTCVDASLLQYVCTSVSSARSHKDAHPGESAPEDGSKNSQQ